MSDLTDALLQRVNDGQARITELEAERDALLRAYDEKDQALQGQIAEVQKVIDAVMVVLRLEETQAAMANGHAGATTAPPAAEPKANGTNGHRWPKMKLEEAIVAMLEQQRQQMNVHSLEHHLRSHGVEFASKELPPALNELLGARRILRPKPNVFAPLGLTV